MSEYHYISISLDQMAVFLQRGAALQPRQWYSMILGIGDTRGGLEGHL
jgi:hypothetical protein